jgi:thiol-disulfide isomerase/thioredoxin
MDWERWIVFYGEWVALAIMASAAGLGLLANRRNPRFVPTNAMEWIRTLAAVAIFGCGGFLMVLMATVNAAGVREMYRELDAATGQPAPDLVLERLDGTAVRLDEFAGNVILLNLWASWCGPCVREMPELDRLQATFGARGVSVVHLSREDPEIIETFIQALPTRATHLRIDEASLPRPFDVTTVPTTILIDRQGVVRESYLGPRDYEFFASRVGPLL